MEQLSLCYYNHKSTVRTKHIRREAISYYDLTIVTKGTLHYFLNDQPFVLKSGGMILFRPGEIRQRLDSPESAEYYSFNFFTDMDLHDIPSVSQGLISDEISQLLIVCNLFFHRYPDHYVEKVAHLLTAILIHIRDSVSESQVNPLALQIKNYIIKNFSSHINLQEIAEKFHFSSSYCNSVFKRETKKSIVDFLIEERMRHAKELLIHTNFPLPQIAVEVGYDDYNYFSRLFKKHALYTPTQYRNLYSDK